MQKPKFVFHCYLPFHSKGRKVVTAGGSIQKFMISNIKYVDDDPIFSVSGDIAMNWWYHDNEVQIALTGGHISDEDSSDQNTHGLGIHSRLSNAKKAEAIDLVSKIEISNIQNCRFLIVKQKCERFKEEIMEHASKVDQSTEIMLVMFQTPQLNSLPTKI